MYLDTQEPMVQLAAGDALSDKIVSEIRARGGHNAVAKRCGVPARPFSAWMTRASAMRLCHCRKVVDFIGLRSEFEDDIGRDLTRFLRSTEGLVGVERERGGDE